MVRKELFLGKMPMNLQFFGEGDGAGSEGDGAGAGSGDEGNKGDEGSGGKSFDEFLKDSKNQAEFDRRVAKALDTQKSKLQEEIKNQIANAKTEAEKLAKMNAEQKANYEKEKLEKELAEREASITKRELMAEAKSTLAEKKLPLQLAEILNYKSADDCNASIEAVEKAFQEAVSQAVNDKLRGGNPPRKPDQGAKIYTMEQINNMTADEINSNWDAVQASLRINGGN